MSLFVCEGTQKIRIKGVYKSFGVATAPGAGANMDLIKPDGTVFANYVLGAGMVDDGVGAVHVDVTMPAGPYGIWWAKFLPGATVAGVGEDWFTLSPPTG